MKGCGCERALTPSHERTWLEGGVKLEATWGKDKCLTRADTRVHTHTPPYNTLTCLASFEKEEQTRSHDL
ncbi:hypothetical protein Pmani_012152 [Petrolisthes manimaculis]|uniref:Uncharacterized protein n=1 Tax=Petrolisthes manimaculis TaxID=1843537 RepID=A0AAE1PYA8_9EUCA|nr:hypothetical protein Pmani_039679 [Petrolisthes manimaculis]KAK4316704.1 hypothetical protein Pmani_012152 [Petrolisthes manimaculis]